MKLTDGAVALAKEMLKEDGSDTMLFFFKKVEGGLTLGIGAIKAGKDDRVLTINGMQVSMTQEVENMLGDIEIDAEGEQFVINADCCGDDCDCGCTEHSHDDCDCGCGGHSHDGCDCEEK